MNCKEIYFPNNLFIPNWPLSIWAKNTLKKNERNTTFDLVKNIRDINNTRLVAPLDDSFRVDVEEATLKGYTKSRCVTISRLLDSLKFACVAGCTVLLTIYIIKFESFKLRFYSHPLINDCLEKSINCQLDDGVMKFYKHLNEKFHISSSAGNESLDFSYPRCSARLVLQGDIQSDSNSHNSFQVIRGWSYFAKNTHIALECINPNDDFSSFKISKGGTYLISVQLSFFATDELLKKAFNKHFFIGQKIFSNDYQLLQQSRLVSVPQLEVGQPMPGCGDGRGSLHVSTLTGLIDLEAGENLTIHAIPVNWLCRWKSASFFSLYKID